MRLGQPFGFRKAILLTALLGLLAGVTAGVFLGLTRDLPQIRELENFEPSAVTRIISADGEPLSERFIEKRIPIPIDRIPEALKKALIVTEDRKFYNHSGIDLKGIVRAIIKDIMARHFVEGASTITQQLAKTLFLTQEKTLSRKIKEAILAIQLERRYTKDEILSLYLNQIYFGSGTYGVESAARRYFGIPAAEMNLAQCALIAGLPKAPSRLSPLSNPDLAKKRRDLVLSMMRTQKVIDTTAYREAIAQPVLGAHPPSNGGKAPFFVAHILPALEAEVGPTLLYKGGLTVQTTLSAKLQRAAKTAVEKGLADIRKRRAAAGVTGPAPQAALVAIDVKTGGILAMVGGSDFSQSAFNRTTHARRQPGSAFKPIVYALAISRGFTQASSILDAPVVFNDDRPDSDWRPQNFSHRYQGEMTLRYALAHSKNIPAVRLMAQLGPSAVVAFAHELGIDTALPPYLSTALGSTGVPLVALTAAYRVFPAGGNHIRPFGVYRIMDRQHRQRYRVRPDVRQAMRETDAAVMVDMLKAVVAEGTGRKALRIGLPVGGKTGTTNDYRDALFVGFSPAVVTGVWVGMDDDTTLGELETGARAALPIWIDFMQATISDGAPLYFSIPDGTRQFWIDPLTGRPASETDKGSVKALFVSGTEPEPKS